MVTNTSVVVGAETLRLITFHLTFTHGEFSYASSLLFVVIRVTVNFKGFSSSRNDFGAILYQNYTGFCLLYREK